MIKCYYILVLLFYICGCTSPAKRGSTGSTERSYITSHNALSMKDFSNSIYALGVEKCWPDSILEGTYSGYVRDVYEKPIYYDIRIYLQLFYRKVF